jgi:gamma-glutamyltranspeptidase/glutathione hydrolase
MTGARPPAGANPKQFLHPDGTPMSYAEAVMGGQSSGVPGAIAMLDMAQKDHGKLPWKALFAPAHELATDGFIVSPRLASMIVSRAPQAHGEDARPISAMPTAADEGGRPPDQQGLCGQPRPDRGQPLRRTALGPAGRGDPAAHPHRPLSLADDAGRYGRLQAAQDRGAVPPLSRLCHLHAAGPSGGLPLQEAMGILAHTDIDKRSAKDEKGWYLLSQASRLAYADRDKYEGDPAFVPVPTEACWRPTTSPSAPR